jgi:hypothetical protein
VSLRGWRTVAGGALRGQWRRGSSWRVGLGSYDLDRHTISAWRGPPILGRELRDHPTTFAADPFLFRWEDAWYLFYESFPEAAAGRISVSRSTDLTDWVHLGTVIHTDEHLSYPTITVVRGEPRLVVESSSARRVGYYKPLEFPTRWEGPISMLSGEAYADPTLFRHSGRWWLFAETSGGRNDRLELYSTEDDGWARWDPHPASPISTDPGWARPAGPLVLRRDGSIIRFGQDNSDPGVYGRRVAALEIDRLDASGYHERLVGHVRFEKRPSWAAERSHHTCVVALDDGRSIVAVDGRGYLTLRDAASAALPTLRTRRRPR